MLDAIIFDFDGVIVDTPTYYFKHMREYLKKLNTNITDGDVSELVGLTFSKKLEYINKKYNLKGEREPFVSKTSEAMMAEMHPDQVQSAQAPSAPAPSSGQVGGC